MDDVSSSKTLAPKELEVWWQQLTILFSKCVAPAFDYYYYTAGIGLPIYYCKGKAALRATGEGMARTDLARAN